MTRTASKAKTETKVDPEWAVLEHPKVGYVLDLAARSIANQFNSITTYDDMHQEGAILLAVNSEYVESVLEDALFGERNLYKWLHDRLYNTVRTDAAHANRAVSYEALEDAEAAE